MPPALPETRSATTQTRDGQPLDLWILDGPQPPCGIVIACHGYSATHLQVIEAADGLRRRGYTVILFDLRGHGVRAPGICTFGVRESEDVGSIIAWVRDQPPWRSLPIGLLGWSLGGAVACQAAMQYPEIKALVLDSTYARFFPIVARAIRKQHPWAIRPLARLSWLGVQIRLGARLGPRDPVVVMSRLSKPGLLIHGGEDQTVPLEHGQPLYERWQGPKMQWIDPHAAHVRTFANDPEGYCTRVADFFDQWLRADARC